MRLLTIPVPLLVLLPFAAQLQAQVTRVTVSDPEAVAQLPSLENRWRAIVYRDSAALSNLLHESFTAVTANQAISRLGGH